MYYRALMLGRLFGEPETETIATKKGPMLVVTFTVVMSDPRTVIIEQTVRVVGKAAERFLARVEKFLKAGIGDPTIYVDATLYGSATGRTGYQRLEANDIQFITPLPAQRSVDASEWRSTPGAAPARSVWCGSC